MLQLFVCAVCPHVKERTISFAVALVFCPRIKNVVTIYFYPREHQQNSFFIQSGPLHDGLGLFSVCSNGSFSFLYLKKLKFQKYRAVSKIFKTIPLSPPAWATGGLSPSGWATGPKRKKNYIYVKKITFRFWRPGRIKQRTCKIDIKSQKNQKNTNSTVLDSMKQDLQLLLYNSFGLVVLI